MVDGTVPSLVFGELTTGRYDLFEKGHPDDVVLTVDVEGGQVATAVWPVTERSPDRASPWAVGRAPRRPRSPRDRPSGRE